MLTQSDEEDIIMVFDSSGTPLASITHGLGVDEPLALEDHTQNTIYYYTTDALGSITALTDSNANIIEQYQYSSFGELTILNSQGQTIPASTLNPLFPHYTYTAREHDPETNLYFYRARYYDAEVGRFINEDPIGFVAGINFYVYVLNNPIRYIDPDGLYPIPVPIPGPIPAGNEKECKQKECPPCPEPPPPTYRIDFVPPSRPHGDCPGDHIHIITYEYNQNPKTCQCFLRSRERVICL